GHLMVVPNRHTSCLEELTKAESSELFELIQKASRVMKKALHPEGMNVGLNLGQAGGAGIRDHLHFHMVPRWLADTNFWPVLSATKGIPQHLDSTYLVLKKTWEAL
ncbi:MAG: HIT domain-containing protein, partial [Deltaproteobacteria bacterium]|nr:HIT domain-containing protein [Deltaproteobacteria bacterium]